MRRNGVARALGCNHLDLRQLKRASEAIEERFIQALGASVCPCRKRAPGYAQIYLRGAIAVAGILLIRSGDQFDSESKAFVDAAIPAIAGNWDEQALRNRASARFLALTSPRQIHAAFRQFATLGRMVRYEGSHGDTAMAYSSGTDGAVTAAYIANATFQNGDAVFQLNLVRHHGRWLIGAMHVTPTAIVRSARAHA